MAKVQKYRVIILFFNRLGVTLPQKYARIMQKAIILILALVFLPPASAQMHRYNTGFSVEEKNFADTIPVEFDDDQVYVPVKISGRTYRFCLDTGSSQGMLYEGSRVPVVQELGSVVSTDANGVKDTVGVAQLADFTLGGLHISGYVASVVKKPAGRTAYDGIIGFDLFNKGIAAKIDPKHGRLILSDRKGFLDGEPGQELKYKLARFVPYIYISPFMRHTDLACFDTGARQLYQMNREHFLDHQYKSKQVSAQVEGHATGYFTASTNSVEKPGEVYFLNLDRLKWNEFAFRNVRCLTTQGDSRVGSQIFNYGSVVILPRKKVLRFQSYNAADSVNVSNKQFGVAFINRDGHPTVGLIWHKSEAYKKGMRQGDVVLSIDGKRVESYDDFAAMRTDEGQTRTLVLRDRRGFNKEITITR